MLASNRIRLAVVGLLAALGPGITPAARAVPPLTGTYTGADGTPVSGQGMPLDGGGYWLIGNSGQPGIPAYSGTYQVINATARGGRGGSATGADGATRVSGGNGGNGLDVESGAAVTIGSGTFAGGAGGAGAGTALLLISGGYQNGGFLDGGTGGDGAYVSASTLIVNGGTFQGGQGATATGNAPWFDGGSGGSGLEANSAGVVTINGGSFTGGSGPNETNPGGVANDGDPYAGVYVLDGTVNIYGGTFTGGAFAAGPHGSRPANDGFGLDVGIGSMTLYGSSFTVNGVSNFTGVVPVGSGTITAKLQNNADFTTFTYNVIGFYGGRNGTLTLVATPEPSQSAALTLGALALAGLALKARRRASVRMETPG